MLKSHGRDEGGGGGGGEAEEEGRKTTMNKGKGRHKAAPFSETAVASLEGDAARFPKDSIPLGP